MPIYEYVCEKDGAKLELLRPMSEADKPVEDPDGKGRVFKRVLSSFAAQGASSGSMGTGIKVGAGGGGGGGGGGCCPCGKPHGGCRG